MISRAQEMAESFLISTGFRCALRLASQGSVTQEKGAVLGTIMGTMWKLNSYLEECELHGNVGNRVEVLRYLQMQGKRALHLLQDEDLGLICNTSEDHLAQLYELLIQYVQLWTNPVVYR